MVSIPAEEVRGLHILAALSGGADSVALLLLLKETGCRITAAHYEHGIRGAESLRDKAFCRDLCSGLGIDLITGSGNVPAEAKRTGEGLESCARRMRYAFLHRAREEAGADLIALAHHADDQAETVLMHLLRGAGLKGAGGMSRRSGDLWRPLLSFRKSELIDYLTAMGVSWREDATNRVPDNARNALRQEVIPRMERIFPGSVQALCRSSSIARRENAFLDRMTDELIRERCEAIPFGYRIRTVPEPEETLLARAVRKLIPSTDADQTERILRQTSPVQLSGTVRAERAGIWLYLDFPVNAEPVPFDPDGTTRLSGVCDIISQPSPPCPVRDRRNVQVLKRSALEGTVLRLRKPGDRISPLGMKGTRLLSDVLTDRKIDPPLRRSLPVIARENEILWAVGIGISRYAAVSDEDEALRLECNQTIWGGSEQ